MLGIDIPVQMLGIEIPVQMLGIEIPVQMLGIEIPLVEREGRYQPIVSILSKARFGTRRRLPNRTVGRLPSPARA
jgi:hypothetical protein